MTSCIDLRERCGQLYRIENEQTGVGEPCGRRPNDPWLATLRCLHGHIYAQGGELLGASTDHRGPVANRLQYLPCCRLHQDGEDGVNVIFHVDDFDQVAEIMKPRRRRRLSPEQRAQRTERLRSYRFPPATREAGDERRRDPSGPAAHRAGRRASGLSSGSPGNRQPTA